MKNLLYNPSEVLIKTCKGTQEASASSFERILYKGSVERSRTPEWENYKDLLCWNFKRLKVGSNEAASAPY